MTIIEKIKQSVETATGMPFLYHAAGEINELIARAGTLPVAFAFLLDSGTIDDVNGRYHERVTLAVMFADKSQFDFNAIENEQIIDRMKIKAYKWLRSLRLSNDLNIVSINQTQRLYDSTTDILTGFSVNITIEDYAGYGECELPDVVFEIKANGEYDVVGIDKVLVDVLPQLEELTITQNGEYLPNEGVAGFSKVTANVVPTKRVVIPNMKVTNALIIDGYWAGELVDTSKVTSMSYMFFNCKSLQSLDVSQWDTSKVTDMSYLFSNCLMKEVDLSQWDTSACNNFGFMFQGATNLTGIDVSNFNVSNAKSIRNMFQWVGAKIIDLTNWDVSNVTLMMNIFTGSKLISLTGGRDVSDIINNNICILKGLKVGDGGYGFLPNGIDRASLRALINGLADLTGQTAKTLTLGATLMAKLTEEDIAIATNKNWTIA